MAAYEADKVVVSLIADNAQFDAANKASSQQFQQSMAGIQASGKAAETGVGQFSSALKANHLAMNQNRVAMMEWQHIARGTADQIAAGADLTQVFAQHIGMMSQAMSLSAQGAGQAEGAFAKFANFLGSGWGIAATFALVGIIKLIQAHKSEGDALEEALDKLKKHADATRTSEEADRIWANTLDGLIDRQKKLNDELGKRLETQSATDRADLQQAQNERDVLQQQLTEAQDNLTKLQARLRTLSPTRSDDPNAAGAPAKLAQEVRDAQKKVDDLQAAFDNAADRVTRGLEVIGKAQSDLAGKAKTFGEIMDHNNKVFFDADPAMAGFSQAVYAATGALAKAAQDAASAGVDFGDVEAKYDALRAKFKQTGDVKTYTTEINKLAKALEATAEAAKNAGKQTGELTRLALPVQGTITGRFGEQRPGHHHAGVDIAVPVGTAVKAPAGGTIIEAGTLPGYGNVVFIDHGGGTITRLAHLSQIDVRKGQQVDAGSVIGLSGGAKGAAGSGDSTGPHVHFEVRVGGKAVDPLKGPFTTDAAGVAAKAEAAATELANKQLQSDLDFAKKSDDLDAKILAAKDDQVQDEIARADLAEARVRAEQKTLDAAIDADASAKKAAGLDAATVDAQAKVLREKTDQLADEKIRTIEIQKQAELAKRAHDAADQEYGFQLDDLKASEQFATSAQQRQRIELELIDLKYEQKAADLEYLKLQAERNGKLDEANLLQGQIDHLPYEKASEVAGVQLSNMGPWQSFLKGIPRDAQAANEALQNIAVNGLHSLVDGLGEAGAAWIKMGGVAGQIIRQIVADLIKLILYQSIAHLFGNAIGPNPFGAEIPTSILGSSPLMPSGAGLNLNIPTLAGGGMGVIGGFGGVDNNLLALNGQPIAWVSKGEGLSVTPSNARAMTGGSGDLYVSMPIYANDAVLASTVRGWVNEGMAMAIQGGTQGGAALARGNLAKRQLHALS